MQWILMSSTNHQAIVAPEQVWMGPSAARVFFLHLKKCFLERLNFLLFIERTSLEILGLLSSFIFLASYPLSLTTFSNLEICALLNDSKY